jgi:hypothetical protein
VRRAARTGLLLGLVAAAAAQAGCSAVKVYSASEPAPTSLQGEWAAARNQATRRAMLYDRFSHRATATVTYLSAPVRQARVNRLAEWMGWTEQEKAARLKTELAEAQKYDDFMVSFYTSDQKDNDLDAKKSIWRMALKLEGGDLVTRDALALDSDATLRTLFPFVSPFDVAYRVRFDKAPGAPLADRPFTLEFASALGKLPLQFGDGTLGPDRPEGTPLPGS